MSKELLWCETHDLSTVNSAYCAVGSWQFTNICSMVPMLLVPKDAPWLVIQHAADLGMTLIGSDLGDTMEVTNIYNPAIEALPAGRYVWIGETP